MTEPTGLLPVLDSPPTRWVDSHDILANLTDEEIRRGLDLGQTIGRDNDFDIGDTPRGLSRPVALSNSIVIAQNIKTALLDHGAGKVVSPWTKRVGGVSIELQAGRGTGGFFVARLHHHTASATISPSVLTPALYTCKNGRSDLQGPLCNGYGGGDFVYRIITLEWANHPGLGGPMTFSKGTVPKDNGRPYLWGTEWDHDGVSGWMDEELEWMARCDAGLADYFNQTVEDQGEHKNWAPLRKVDRNVITRAASISRTRAVYNTPVEEEDVPNTKTEIQTWVNECIENKLGLLPGTNMALGIVGQTNNSLAFSKLLNTNDSGSLISIVRAIANAQTAQGQLLAAMAADLGDDEADVLAGIKTAIDASNDEILAAIDALDDPADDGEPVDPPTN